MQHLFEAVHLIVGLAIFATCAYAGFKSRVLAIFLGLLAVGIALGIAWPFVLGVLVIFGLLYLVLAVGTNTYWKLR